MNIFFARMLGLCRIEELNKKTIPLPLRKFVSTKNNGKIEFVRYQMTKLKNELRDHWGLIYYANHTRGFYVTFEKKGTNYENKTIFEDLVYHVEKQRKKYLEKQRRKKENEAINRAKERLYATTAA